MEENLRNGMDVGLYTTWLQLKQYYYSWCSTRKNVQYRLPNWNIDLQLTS